MPWELLQQTAQVDRKKGDGMQAAPEAQGTRHKARCSVQRSAVFSRDFRDLSVGRVTRPAQNKYGCTRLVDLETTLSDQEAECGMRHGMGLACLHVLG
jgi:hypothetical protein